MLGTLIIAGTSIGEPLDIPRRTLEAVVGADLLLFEEDRPARQVLKQAGIHRDYLRHNEHKNKNASQEVREALTRGETVTYVCDQGMPNVEDPGSDLVAIAFELGAKITIIPGPSSITSAIAAAPFDCGRFVYLGLLPRDESERKLTLSEYTSTCVPKIVLDAPYRLKNVLKTCVEVFGRSHVALVALDISGPDEDYWYAELYVLVERAELLEKKLNFVVIVR